MNLKANDIPNIQHNIPFSNLENIFNVFEEEGGQYFYNILKTVNIPENLDPQYYDIYTVNQGDVWPSIAYKFYKNVNLWWLICTTNQVQDASAFPKPGTDVKIIKPEFVTEILNKLSEQ